MHISKIHELVEKGEFSIEFVSEKGELVKVPRATCSTFHSAGKTMNIHLLQSNQVRTIRRVTITKFNGKEVWL